MCREAIKSRVTFSGEQKANKIEEATKPEQTDFGRTRKSATENRQSRFSDQSHIQSLHSLISALPMVLIV